MVPISGLEDNDMGSTKKCIVAVIDIDEEHLSRLPRGRELGSLPDLLDEAVGRLAAREGLDLDQVFLLTGERKEVMIEALERCSLPYHDYVVDRRGERCIRLDCSSHRGLARVIPFRRASDE
jgi:hypothetical protein